MWFLMFILWFLPTRVISTKVTDEEYAMMPSLFQIDDYDKCLQLGRKALFCEVQFDLRPEDPKNTSRVWRIIKKVSSNPKNYRHDWLRHGVCIPTTCPDIPRNHYFIGNDNQTLIGDFNDCYNAKFKNMGLLGNTSYMHCEGTEPFYSVDGIDITVGLVLLTYLFLVVAATFYEGLHRYESADVYKLKITKGTVGKYVSCFSLIKNWERLTTETTNPDSIRLKSIQGLRFYTMVCIILAHTAMVAYFMPVVNPTFNEQATDKTLNMFVANGSYVVQTFYGISGWLVAFHLFDMTKNKKTLSFGYILFAIVNRYIRLMPPLLVVYLLTSTWMVHLGDGPYWDRVVGSEYRFCRENGWSNLIFINNYYHKEDMCLPHTWYMASDSQVFVVAILVTWLMKMYEKHALKIAGTAITIATIIPMVINYIYDFDIVTRRYAEPLYHLMMKVPQHHIMFNSGYCNIAGYLVGVMFGYLFFKHRNKNFFPKKIYVVVWWIFVWVVPVVTILIAAFMYDDNYENSRVGAAFYVGISKTLFPLGIMLLIFGFTQQQGWFMRWFTEWNPVQVLGRLTYSAYLVHVSLLRMRGGRARTPFYVSDATLISTTIGDITLSYLTATCLCLIVEMPISALQKLLIFESKPKETLQHKEEVEQASVKLNGE